MTVLTALSTAVIALQLRDDVRSYTLERRLQFGQDRIAQANFLETLSDQSVGLIDKLIF